MKINLERGAIWVKKKAPFCSTIFIHSFFLENYLFKKVTGEE